MWLCAVFVGEINALHQESEMTLIRYWKKPRANVKNNQWKSKLVKLSKGAVLVT
uniref:Uncharacterized protein n=1 Tax=Anguilla anguilla TaxID=7936 RepID=A0A0E9WJR2_ANGAN